MPAPAAPTPSAKSAEAPATAAATGTSEGVEGTEAHAANENTRNSGPGGCQSCASESSDPPAATSAATGTASQLRCGEVPTSVPRVTDAVSSTASVACIRARDSRTLGAAVERGEGAEGGVDRQLQVAGRPQHQQRHEHRDRRPGGHPVGAAVRAHVQQLRGQSGTVAHRTSVLRADRTPRLGIHALIRRADLG